MKLLRLLLLLTTISVDPPTALAARPNVIVVLADDVGYGDLACHGNPVIRTPHLDRLRAESTRFTDFHSAPYCTPTRGQLLTGCDALRNGATRVCGGRSFIRPDAPTMAEIFSRASYRTGQFGKWHLGDNAPHRPHDRGFDSAKYHLGWGLASAQEVANDYANGRYRDRGETKDFAGFCTDFWFDEAMNWMRERGARREPFLCYLPLNAAHGPFWAPGKSAAPYHDQAPVIAAFYGLIANLDDNIGRLEAMLRETGLRENTIVIFTTDNGTAAGQRVFNAAMRGIKGDVHDGGHRVPCFVRWPGGKLREPGDIATPAQMQDILPTLLELTGVKAPRGVTFDGASLAPLLRSESGKLPDRKFVVQLHTQKWNCAVVWNQWRLVQGAALYDLRRDPGQSNDVAAAHTDVVRELRAHYEAWWAGVAPRLGEFLPVLVGSERENPVLLTSADWQDVDDPFCGDAHSVRRVPGALRGAPWNIEVARAGDYEVTLRRWPAELNVPIRAGLPERKPSPGLVGTTAAAGRALTNIATAKIIAAGQQQEQRVAAEAASVTFKFRLPAGRAQIHAWFTDAAGIEQCGAFYATVTAR